MSQQPKIYIAGHRGMVGAALIRQLQRDAPAHQIITRTHAELELTDSAAVHAFFANERPTQVYLAAARVGGIWANNTYPAEFIYDNLMIASNIIHAAWQFGVERLLFLGSSCIYPRLAPQPIPESALLTGVLEPTNEPYAIAKIAGIKLCESFNRQYGTDFRCVMPTNLYGPGDNFHSEHSHVIPALLRKFHDAKVTNQPSVSVWGNGNVYREFLYVDDLAAACVFIMNIDQALYHSHTQPQLRHINVGSGIEITIHTLAELMQPVTGYTGSFHFDTDKPDGTPRKLLDVSCLAQLGWRATTSLASGLQQTYAWFLANQTTLRR